MCCPESADELWGHGAVFTTCKFLCQFFSALGLVLYRIQRIGMQYIYVIYKYINIRAVLPNVKMMFARSGKSLESGTVVKQNPGCGTECSSFLY